MNGQVLQVLWLLALTILALVNVLALIVKSKKSNPSNYGERIASLETDMKNVKDNIKEIKKGLSKKG